SSSVPPPGSDRAEYMQTLQYWVRFDRNFILAAAVLAYARGARAHDSPDEVRVQAFVKPEGQALKLLVRMPLKAMRDVDVPQRQGGFLDFTRVDSSLRDAVALWLAGEIELYEDDARLGKPKLVDARVSLESDRSFAAYESALAHFKEPRLGNDTELYWNQGLLDVLLEYPVRSQRSAFSIRPLIELLIAASIFYMAAENVLGSSLQRRWVIAFAFGLVHGFGFAYGLQQLLQFAGSHLITSLLAFNLGVELGQLLALIVLVPLL